MRCPICGKGTKIVDSVSDRGSVYRRRKCTCGFFCYTTETALKSSWKDFETAARGSRIEKKESR